MVLTEILEVGDLSANMKAELLLRPLPEQMQAGSARHSAAGCAAVHVDAILPEQQEAAFDLHTALRGAADSVVLALQPMGYKMHCETDPEKALKWVYESVVLPDIGELAASPAYWSCVTLHQCCPVWSVCQCCATFTVQHGQLWCIANSTATFTDNVGCCLQCCWTA